MTHSGVEPRRKRLGTRRVKSVTCKPDSEIDFSDIPESSDEELSRATRLGRPKSAVTKQLIAIRLDPKLINKLRKLAKSEETQYQTLIHKILEEAVEDVA